MHDRCPDRRDQWEKSREAAFAAFERARQQMLAKPLQAQISAYRARARDLVPYLEPEELSREAQLADQHRQRLLLVRHDLAGAEREVRNIFDQAFSDSPSPYVPRSRGANSAAKQQVFRSSHAVVNTPSSGAQNLDVPRLGRVVKVW